MNLFYSNVTKKVTLPLATEFLANLSISTLERNVNSFLSLPPVFFVGVFRHVTDADDREVPCITMGLRNKQRYKCFLPSYDALGGEALCLTL
jgi:hypothetical protein